VCSSDLLVLQHLREKPDPAALDVHEHRLDPLALRRAVENAPRIDWCVLAHSSPPKLLHPAPARFDLTLSRHITVRRRTSSVQCIYVPDYSYNEYDRESGTDAARQSRPVTYSQCRNQAERPAPSNAKYLTSRGLRTPTKLLGDLIAQRAFGHLSSWKPRKFLAKQHVLGHLHTG